MAGKKLEELDLLKYHRANLTDAFVDQVAAFVKVKIWN
jgi:hypothetical protein